MSDDTNTSAGADYFKVAEAYYNTGKYREAEEAFRRHVESDRTRSAYYLVIEFYLSKLIDAADENRFEEALTAVRSAATFFHLGMYISPVFAAAVERLERIEREDSGEARKRSACLYASYISAFGYSFMELAEPRMPWHWYEKALEYREPQGERDPLELKIHYRAGMTYWYGLGSVERWRPRLSEDDYYEQPRYEDACEAFERSVALYEVKDWGGRVARREHLPV